MQLRRPVDREPEWASVTDSPLIAGYPSARPLSRRAFLAGGAAAAAVPLFLSVPGAVSAPALATDFGFPPADAKGVYVKHIVFPVVGAVSWIDTFGACRDGCTRHHEGQDLFARKSQRLIAAVSGTVVVLRHRSTGNSMYIRSDADGWYYGYMHINNDTPGTDDGVNRFSQAFAPHMATGVHVGQGQPIGYLGDSGNAENTPSHCHFEIRKPASSVWHSQAVNAKYSLRAARSGAGSSGRHGSHLHAPSGRPALHRGERGASVAGLQWALNYGTRSRLVADGYFGALTEDKVKNLQRWFKLGADGVYGLRSQMMLQFACDKRAGL